MTTTKEQKLQFRNKIKKSWYENLSIQPIEIRQTKFYKVIEQYGFEIIKNLGFKDIIKLPYQFSVDAIATDKNNKRWLIDFTCSWHKEISRTQEILCKETNKNILFIFIKPDKSCYFIKRWELGDEKRIQLSVTEIPNIEIKRKDKAKVYKNYEGGD